MPTLTLTHVQFAWQGACTQVLRSHSSGPHISVECSIVAAPSYFRASEAVHCRRESTDGYTAVGGPSGCSGRGGLREEEEEDSEGVPSPSNNFNFPPDIVARFEEGYRSNPAAGMEAMRKTYVLIFTPHSLAHTRPSACMVQNLASVSYIAIFLSSDPWCCVPGSVTVPEVAEQLFVASTLVYACSSQSSDVAGMAKKHRWVQHAGAAAALLCNLQGRPCSPCKPCSHASVTSASTQESTHDNRC